MSQILKLIFGVKHEKVYLSSFVGSDAGVAWVSGCLRLQATHEYHAFDENGRDRMDSPGNSPEEARTSAGAVHLVTRF